MMRSESLVTDTAYKVRWRLKPYTIRKYCSMAQIMTVARFFPARFEWSRTMTPLIYRRLHPAASTASHMSSPSIWWSSTFPLMNCSIKLSSRGRMAKQAHKTSFPSSTSTKLLYAGFCQANEGPLELPRIRGHRVVGSCRTLREDYPECTIYRRISRCCVYERVWQQRDSSL